MTSDNEFFLIAHIGVAREKNKRSPGELSETPITEDVLQHRKYFRANFVTGNN